MVKDDRKAIFLAAGLANQPAEYLQGLQSSNQDQGPADEGSSFSGPLEENAVDGPDFLEVGCLAGPVG